MDHWDLPKVSYSCKNGSPRDKQIRFSQYSKDPLPKWATDVRACPTDREELQLLGLSDGLDRVHPKPK